MFGKIHNIHFIGMGGMGVSALARLAVDSGLTVTGSDLNRNITTEALESLGAKIHYGSHAAENIDVCHDAVVFSRAIEKDNPERLEAKSKDIPLFSYPEFIGKITKNKKVIAVCGTHGKTTTTGLVGKLLIDAGFDPTVIIGSYITDFNGNARLGKSEYVVLEADEYRNAFAYYDPFISIVTTIDFDHPDYFSSLEDVQKHFQRFLEKTSDNGVVVANNDDAHVQHVLELLPEKKKLLCGDDAQYRYAHIRYQKHSLFDMHFENEKVSDLELALPGKHNIQNALLVYAAAHFLKIDESIIRKTFAEYHGAWRRFEVKAEKNDILVVDDYAHHPKEIEVTIQAARDRIDSGRVIAVFQPHHQERTRVLFKDFVSALSYADCVILTDIYRVPGRADEQEIDIEGMSREIRKHMKDVSYVADLADIPQKVSSIAQSGDIILVMGAGDINTITPQIIEAL